MPSDLLLLEDEQALALHPDGQGLVSFDSETGEGAECCCEPPAPPCGGTCCWSSSKVPRTCGLLNPVLNARCVCFKIDVAETATFTSDNITGCGKTMDLHNNLSVVVVLRGSLDGGPCATGLTVVDSCVSVNVNRKIQHPTAPCSTITDVFSSCSDPRAFPFQPGVQLNFIEHAGGGTFSFLREMIQLRILPTWIPGIPVNYFACSRTVSGYDIPGCSPVPATETNFTQTFSRTTAGGSFSYNQLHHCVVTQPFQDRYRYQAQGTATWSYAALIDCAGNPTGATCAGTSGGGSDGGGDPLLCDQFIAAWIAGDAIADFNGDGFVNGDDFDAFMLEHPDCLPGSIGQRSSGQVQALRRANRRALRGALSTMDLLR